MRDFGDFERLAMNCCNDYGNCTKGFNCPVRETSVDSDALILRESIKGAAFVVICAISIAGAVLVIYFKG